MGSAGSQRLSTCLTIISPLLAPKLNTKIPYQTGNFKDYLNRKDAKGKLFINSSNNSLFLSPTCPMEVERIIDGLDMKKATGPNSTRVFKTSSLQNVNTNLVRQGHF